MNFAIIGCGYVADCYMATLGSHPTMRLAGAWDHDPQRLKAFTSYHGVRAYSSLQEALSDAGVGLIANLTNPRSHYVVSHAALMAGKHAHTMEGDSFVDDSLPYVCRVVYDALPPYFDMILIAHVMNARIADSVDFIKGKK